MYILYIWEISLLGFVSHPAQPWPPKVVILLRPHDTRHRSFLPSNRLQRHCFFCLKENRTVQFYAKERTPGAFCSLIYMLSMRYILSISTGTPVGPRNIMAHLPSEDVNRRSISNFRSLSNKFCEVF